MSAFNDFLSIGSQYLKGKDHQLKMAFIAVVARGHLLLEDSPGMGKTTLVHLVANLLGMKLSRIQFTNDLLPADIVGTNIFDQSAGKFTFKKGPLFGELILADELNRATPKTQSALLQAMEEHSVSVDGVTYKIGDKFLVMATQNPRGQIGTYPLPESQLDRFFMGLTLGLPDREGEREILRQGDIREMVDALKELAALPDFIELHQKAMGIELSNPLLDYVLDLLSYARHNFESFTLSPRAGKDLILAAQIHALLAERSAVYPEDVQAVAPSVWGHRLGASAGVAQGARWAQELIHNVRIP